MKKSGKSLCASANPTTPKKKRKTSMAKKKKGGKKSSSSKASKKKKASRNPFNMATLKERVVKPAKSVGPTLAGAAFVETVVQLAPLPIAMRMGMAGPLTRAGAGLVLGFAASFFGPTKKFSDALAEGGLVSGGLDLVRAQVLPRVLALLPSSSAVAQTLGELPGRFHLIPERGVGDTIIREHAQIGETFVREKQGVAGGPDTLSPPWGKSIYDN